VRAPLRALACFWLKSLGPVSMVRRLQPLRPHTGRPPPPPPPPPVSLASSPNCHYATVFCVIGVCRCQRLRLRRSGCGLARRRHSRQPRPLARALRACSRGCLASEAPSPAWQWTSPHYHEPPPIQVDTPHLKHSVCGFRCVCVPHTPLTGLDFPCVTIAASPTVGPMPPPLPPPPPLPAEWASPSPRPQVQPTEPGALPRREIAAPGHSRAPSIVGGGGGASVRPPLPPSRTPSGDAFGAEHSPRSSQFG